jgi:hypothetical protein
MKNSVQEELEPQSFVEENRIIGNTVLEANDSLSFVTTIRHNIQHPDHKKVIIVVEGEDDEKALKQFFNIKDVEFFCANNCLKVKNAMQIVSKDEQLKDCVIGIKDADFDHINQIKHNIANLMITDTHDMETLMLTPKVYRKICLYTTNKEYPELSTEAMKALKNFSYLRYYNDKMILNRKDSDKEGINFKGIKIADVASHSVQDVLQHVKDNGGNYKKTSYPDLDTINLFISQNPIDDEDLTLFTNGHDLVYAIRDILHKDEAAKAYSDKSIATMIRISYSKEEFEKTNLHKDIDNWNNNRFNLWAV